MQFAGARVCHADVAAKSSLATSQIRAPGDAIATNADTLHHAWRRLTAATCALLGDSPEPCKLQHWPSALPTITWDSTMI